MPLFTVSLPRRAAAAVLFIAGAAFAGDAGCARAGIHAARAVGPGIGA